MTDLAFVAVLAVILAVVLTLEVVATRRERRRDIEGAERAFIRSLRRIDDGTASGD